MIIFLLSITNHYLGLEHFPTPFIGETYVDVEKADTFLYFATVRGLEIYTWQPEAPYRVSKFASDGIGKSIDFDSGYVYLADDYNGLCIIDVSNPLLPRRVGHFDTNGNTKDVAVHNGLAFLADWQNGMVIADVSDPTCPFEVARCLDINKAITVTLDDTLVYVGDFTGPLKIINAADPSNPHVIGQFPTDTLVSVFDVLIEDTLAYMTSAFWAGTVIYFAIVNVKDPTTPEYIAGISFEELPPPNRGIIKFGNHVYLNAQSNGIYIIDVTDPLEPFIAGNYQKAYEWGHDYYISDSLMIVPHGAEGFSILNIIIPQTPIPIYYHRNVNWQQFSCEDSLNYLYTLGHIEELNQYWHLILKIVEIANPLEPNPAGELWFSGKGTLYEKAVDHPYLALYVVRDNVPYTAIIDVSNPSVPVLDRFEKGGGPTDLKTPYVYCLDGGTIRIADITNPSFWIDSIVVSDTSYDLSVKDTIVFVSIPDSIIAVNIASGTILGGYFHGHPYAVNTSLDPPYLAIAYTPFPGSSYGFFLLDITNPAAPSLMCDTVVYDQPISTMDIAIVSVELCDSLLFLGRALYGFDIWKVIPPDSVHRIISQETPQCVHNNSPCGYSNIHLHNNIIFVADGNGLEMYRITGQGIDEKSYIIQAKYGPVLRITPNPFKEKTRIDFIHKEAEKPVSCEIIIKIYDIAGRFVKGLPINITDHHAGYVFWDGKNAYDKYLPQGIYFVKLETEHTSCLQKVILLR